MTGNAYYCGKIKVVCEDLTCFPVDPKTLKALATAVYDPWAWADPDPAPVETITVAEWNRRRQHQRERPPRSVLHVPRP